MAALAISCSQQHGSWCTLASVSQLLLLTTERRHVSTMTRERCTRDLQLMQARCGCRSAGACFASIRKLPVGLPILPGSGSTQLAPVHAYLPG